MYAETEKYSRQMAKEQNIKRDYSEIQKHLLEFIIWIKTKDSGNI